MDCELGDHEHEESECHPLQAKIQENEWEREVQSLTLARTVVETCHLQWAVQRVEDMTWGYHWALGSEEVMAARSSTTPFVYMDQEWGHVVMEWVLVRGP
jgi:hypothetical protein